MEDRGTAKEELARWSGVEFFWMESGASPGAAEAARAVERGTRVRHARTGTISRTSTALDLALEAARRADLALDRVVTVGRPAERGGPEPGAPELLDLDLLGSTTCARSVGLLGTLARVRHAQGRALGRVGTLVHSREGRLVAGHPSEWGTCRVHATGELACLVRPDAGPGWRFGPLRRWTIGEHGSRAAHLGPERGLPRFVPGRERLYVDPLGALGGRAVDGRRLFRGLVARLAHVLGDCLRLHGLTPVEVRQLVLQHANAPLLDAVGAALGLDAAQLSWNRTFVDDVRCASLAEVLAEPGPTEGAGPILVAEFECGYSITATVAHAPHSTR